MIALKFLMVLAAIALVFALVNAVAGDI